MTKNNSEQLQSLSKYEKWWNQTSGRDLTVWCEMEKWGERWCETAFCLIYSLEFGTLDAGSIRGCGPHPWMRGASKQSLSCSEIWAFDFSRCVAYPWMRGASDDSFHNLISCSFAVITPSGCVAHQLMRGASNINKCRKMAELDAWRIR